MPVHLPNELWLHIISHCDGHNSLWLSLRRTNQQLKACVEHFFAAEILPQLVIALPMTLPTYDARNPMREEAVFQYYSGQAESGRIEGTQDRVVFELNDEKPEFYVAHFFGRWAGMKDVDGGWLRPSMQWKLRLEGKEVEARLKDGKAIREGVGEEEARMEFVWKSTLTGLYLS